MTQPPTYRTGRKVGRTIYRQQGAEPANGDELVGLMDTPDLAAIVVDALNAMAQDRLTIDTATEKGQRAWRALCMKAFENLPTDTTVTFADVDAILTWCLPEADRLAEAQYVLLPPGGETREQWGAQVPTETWPHRVDDDRRTVESWIEIDGKWFDVDLVRREVQSWDDGSEWTGPWTVVSEEETDGQ